MPGKRKHSPEAVERRQRQATALRLRLAGAGYRQIADQLGISISTAHDYVSDAVKEITREPAEQVLQMELDRLNEMRLAIWPQVRRGDLKAIDRALRIGVSYARLNGLEQLAAQRIAQDGQELATVDAWLVAMLDGPGEDDGEDDDPAGDPE